MAFFKNIPLLPRAVWEVSLLVLCKGGVVLYAIQEVCPSAEIAPFEYVFELVELPKFGCGIPGVQRSDHSRQEVGVVQPEILEMWSAVYVGRRPESRR